MPGAPSPFRDPAEPETTVGETPAPNPGRRPPRDLSLRGALRAALVYALLSAAWIAFSDQALARLIPDHQAYAVAQAGEANAIAYTRPGGTVRLSTAGLRVGERTFVGARVFNDGPTIDPEDLPHIFERFYRGRTGHESGQPGTGLGLAISREIVERHAGWIEVESGAEGTAFSVWLPAAPAG